MSAINGDGAVDGGARSEAQDRRRASVESSGSVSSMEYGFGEMDLGSAPSGMSPVLDDAREVDENEGYIDVGGVDDSPTAAAAAEAAAAASPPSSPQPAVAAGAVTPVTPAASAVSTETVADRVSPAVAAATVASTPSRRGTIDRPDDAALAFMQARAAGASAGAASAVVHAGHQFAQFNSSPKSEKKYHSVRFKTLRQRQKLAMAEAFGAGAAEEAEEAPKISTPTRSRKALPTSWTNSLRRKKKTDEETVATSCCAQVPPGLSRCSVCGNSW